MSRLKQQFNCEQSGTITVTFAIVGFVLIAFVGVSLTYLDGHRNRSTAQNAIDSAVLGAAGLASNASDEKRVEVATQIFEANFKAETKSSVELHNLKIDVWQTLDEFPEGSKTVTRGRVRAEVENHFSGVLGNRTLTIEAIAAARKASSAPVCILALNESAPQAFEIYGKAHLSAPECAAQSNSSDGAGMRTYGTAEATAANFGVHGNYTGDGFSPWPSTGVDPSPDPYAEVPFPLIEDCIDAASRLRHTPAVLLPGTYCGGLDLKANSDVILEPGIYIMKDGPLDVNSNTRLTGRDVLIAFTGENATLYLGSGAVVDLTSPTSGTWANMQFFQDRDGQDDSWVTILGDAQLTYDGVAYFPGKDLWVGGGSVINANSPSYSLIADRFWLQDNSVLNVTQENRRGLDVEAAHRMELGVRLIY